MKKIARHRLAIALTPIILIAMTSSTRAQVTNALVDALQKKYDRLSTLSTDFVQVYTSSGEKTRREAGKLLLKKPGKMRWDYSSPEAKLFVSDGKMIFEYVPSEGMATRTSVRDSDDMRAPFMFLLGRGNLRRDFKRVETAGEAPAHPGNQVLKLTPKNSSLFRELIVEVQPATLKIDRLTILESGGGRSDFIFSNLQENVPLEDDRFSFKPPAGIRIVSVDK